MLQASRRMKISPIPKTAPFAEDEIEVLNRVVGPASATQRAWLAGFLAGLDAAHAAPQPAAPPQAAEPLTILYATESGNAERLASDVAKSARKLGFKPMLVDMGRGRAAGTRGPRLCRADERKSAAARRRRVRRVGTRRHRLCRVLRNRQGDRRAAGSARRKARGRSHRLRSRFRRARRGLD